MNQRRRFSELLREQPKLAIARTEWAGLEQQLVEEIDGVNFAIGRLMLRALLDKGGPSQSGTQPEIVSVKVRGTAFWAGRVQ